MRFRVEMNCEIEADNLKDCFRKISDHYRNLYHDLDSFIIRSGCSNVYPVELDNNDNDDPEQSNVGC